MEDEMREGAYEPHPTMRPKESILKKIPTHNWAITTYIFAILAVFLLVSSFTGGVTGKAISNDKAGDTLVEYFNSVTGGGVELVSVEDIGNLYEVTVSYEEQEIPVYITKDGDYLVSGAVLLEELESEIEASYNDATQNTQTTNTDYSEEDLEKIQKLSVCLEEADFKIYGANWCGWTEKAVSQFGGFDKISSGIYVECTENEELCSSEEISGYPTIKLKGEAYSGERTLEAFAQATGCSMPTLDNSIDTASNNDANC